MRERWLSGCFGQGKGLSRQQHHHKVLWIQPNRMVDGKTQCCERPKGENEAKESLLASTWTDEQPQPRPNYHRDVSEQHREPEFEEDKEKLVINVIIVGSIVIAVGRLRPE